MGQEYSSLSKNLEDKTGTTTNLAMSKKRNLLLATFFLGGLTTVLPALIKVCLLVGIGLVLFFRYDEFIYEQRCKEEQR